MNNYELLNLYPHNISTCKKVKEAFDNGQDIVSIIKATGTGKSYIGLNLALEYKDEKIIWLVPTNAIKEHVEMIIHSNPNLSMERDFPNLEIRTYSSLINLSDDELEDIDCDLLIVDELHHIGAPVWGEKVNTLIYSHDNMKTFGMSAYSVRDRGTSYERDMTNPDTEEIFSNTVVDRYDLYDAIIDGILPLPVAKTVLTENSAVIEELKEALKVQKLTKKQIQHEIEVTLDALIKTIHKQNPIEEIISESIYENGKYIYFCPVLSYEGINDIETIKQEVVGYIKNKYPDRKVVIYQTTSDMGTLGEKNRNCFYHDIDLEGNDVSNTIRIMFAKNQYNEGVHAPNIDGVFLGRKTGSDIVALEQIGRALSVREDIKEKRLEYSSYDLDKLKELAKKKNILFDEDITKEYLIELLISPMIIDLTGNIEFLEELETNLKCRIKEIKKKSKKSREQLEQLEKYSILMLEGKTKTILTALLNLKNQVSSSTWDDYYELAKEYYMKHGDCEINFKYVTNDNVRLGVWCNTQRMIFKNYVLGSNPELDKRKRKLESIEFRFENKFLSWDEYYNLAKDFYNKNGHSKIPISFKTSNNINLGAWCSSQKHKFKCGKLELDKIKKLEEINFNFIYINIELEWEKLYKLLEIYYNHYGHSEIPSNFKTKNGIDFDNNGYNIGRWCENQRDRFNSGSLSDDKIEKLRLLNFRFSRNKKYLFWNKMYELAEIYYNHYGHSEIPSHFKTKNGIDYDDEGYGLGRWCSHQKRRYLDGKLEEKKIKKLKLINFNFAKNKNDEHWEKMYLLLKKYYQINGVIDIPDNLLVRQERNGEEINLGTWCMHQRQKYRTNKLSDNKIKKLEQIGFRLKTQNGESRWENMYALVFKYYSHYGNSNIIYNFKTKNGIDYDDDGFGIGSWCSAQRKKYQSGELSEDKIKKLELINFRFNKIRENIQEKEKLCNLYGIAYNKFKFLTRISYKELYSKIMFLIDNDMPLEIDEKLHPIFTMSDEHMILTYMVGKEDLIIKYYIHNEEKKK